MLVTVISLNINKKCFESCEWGLHMPCVPHPYREQANCIYLLLGFEANLGCFQNASHYPGVDYVINVEALHPFSIHSLRKLYHEFWSCSPAPPRLSQIFPSMTFCLSPQIKVNLDCLNIFGCVVFHSMVVDLQEAAFFPNSYQLVFKWMNTNITEKNRTFCTITSFSWV